MTRQRARKIMVFIGPLLTLSMVHGPVANAQEFEAGTHPAERSDIQYSPYPEENFPNNVYFGDTHLHTAYSTDAGMIGNTLGPEEAYRFAKGETVISSTGLQARLRRPLDFLVIADHSENLGCCVMRNTLYFASDQVIQAQGPAALF
jgi:hypothetical protein